MAEGRRSERVRSLLGAKIIFNNRMSIVDCVVRNISASGAKLALTDSLTVPGEFELTIPQKGCSYRARLVWRKSEGMGVEFLNADAPRSAEVRLRELEIENAQLKERIQSLSQKLADLEYERNAAPQQTRMAAVGGKPSFTLV